MSAKSSAFESSFVQAMKVIAGTTIQGYKADQTVIGIVKGNVRDNIYEVTYNGGLMTCYAENGAIYMPGSSVYVLIPQGDFGQTKTIISLTSSSSGETGNLSTVVPALDGYEKISNNLLKKTPLWDDKVSIGVHSYYPQYEGTTFQDIVTLYQVAGNGWTPKEWIQGKNSNEGKWDYKQYYELDNIKTKIYSSSAKGFLLKADFHTSLSREQVQSEASGDYGLIIALRFATENTVYSTIEEKWQDLVGQTELWYKYNDQMQRTTLNNFRNEIFNENGEDVFDKKVTVKNNEGVIEERTPTLLEVQQRIEDVKNRLEVFVDEGKKTWNEQVVELSNSYIEWLKQISIYQKDEKDKPITVKKLLKIYKKWFTDELNPDTQNFEKTYRYEFSTNNMLGDPYYFNDEWSTQYFMQSVDFKNFAGIEGIYFYCRNFPNYVKLSENNTLTVEDREKQNLETIKIKNVELFFIDEIDDENTDYKLELEYPKGRIFESYSSSEELKVTGKLIYQKEHNYTSRCTVTWFKEDVNVKTFDDEGYNHWAGAGWKELSSGEKNNSSVSITLKASNNRSYENRYLCVATQSLETVLKAQFVLYNTASKRDIEIISDSGTNFGQGGRTKTLTCLINKKQNNFDDMYADSQYRFKWQKTVGKNITYYDKTEEELKSSISSSGDNITLSSQEEKSLLNTQLTNTEGVSWDENQLIFPKSQVSANEETKITCVVEFNSDPSSEDKWAKIGEASIVLTEQVSGNVKGYNIEIENGNQVFQYNEGGFSPCSVKNSQPYELQPLSCIFHGPSGEVVDDSKYTVKWMWPLENTMLLIDSNLAKENSNTGIKNLYEQKTCPIAIADEYDMNAFNNQITCIVEFAGAVYYKETGFYFGKVGENGSNATEVIAKISPVINTTTLNTDDSISEPLTLHVYMNPNRYETIKTDKNGNVTNAEIVRDGVENPYFYRWNNGDTNAEASLGLQLYKNNVLVDSDEYKSVKWEIAGLNNNISSRMSVESAAAALEEYETCYISYDHSLRDDKNNTYCHNHIVKVSAGLEIDDVSGNKIEQKYYSFYPIPIIVHELMNKEKEEVSYSLGIDNNRTLRQVMYNNDGRSPQYNKNQGVTLKFGDFDEDDNTPRMIKWATKGGIDYNIVETPLSINPKQKGLYEFDEGTSKYVKTEDTFVKAIGNTQTYKKYFNVSEKYILALGTTKVTRDKSITTFWKPVSVTANTNPQEEGLWEKDKNNNYILSKKTDVYEFKDATEDLLNNINPKIENWYIKNGKNKYELTSHIRINHNWYEDNGTIKNNVNGYWKFGINYELIENIPENANPYKKGWYELVSGNYVKTDNSVPQEGKSYYEKVLYTQIKNLEDAVMPYYENFYELKNGAYVKTEDIKWKTDKTYYKQKIGQGEFFTPQGYKLFDEKDLKDIGTSLLLCNPKKQGWYSYDKTNKTYKLTTDTKAYTPKVIEEIKVGDPIPKDPPSYYINVDNSYKLTTDTEVQKNTTYYNLEFNNYYDLVSPQVPCLYEWYTYDSENIKFIRTDAIEWETSEGNFIEYYTFDTKLDEDIETLLKVKPKDNDWYTWNKDTKEYVFANIEKPRAKTYYQRFETVTLAKTVKKVYTAIEGDTSPFLKIIKPDSEKRELVDEAITKYFTLDQAEENIKGLKKEKEKIEKEWEKKSQKLYNVYKKQFIEKVPGEDAYKDKIGLYTYKDDKGKEKTITTAEDMRKYYTEKQEDILDRIAALDKKVQEEVSLLGNSIEIVPSEVYDGETCNNYIFAQIYKCIKDDEDKWVIDEENGLEYSIYVPIHLYLNTYGLTSLNNWDGNSVEINEDERYILAPQIGAGKKNVDDNTFTGLLMGIEKTYTQENEPEQRVGLLGYNHGKQSIWMDAESGKTILGLPEDDAVNAGNPLTEGRIELVPGGTSRISRWRFDSRSLYRVISKNQTNYLEEGLDVNRLYKEDNYDNGDDFETLAKPYERTRVKIGDDVVYGDPAPVNAHGSIPHDQQGILLSAAPAYISIKGRPLTTEDGIDFKEANTVVSEGDTIEVELNPNTRSVFGIYNHLKADDGTWIRKLKAGIDESGRFFSNALKNQEITMYAGYIGAFGQTAGKEKYTGVAWDFSNKGSLVKLFTNAKNELKKESPLYISSSSKIQGKYAKTEDEIPDLLADAGCPYSLEHLKDNPDDYNEWIQKDPDTGWWIKDTSGGEGLRPIGIYGNKYLNIFIGDNDNNIIPVNNITALRATHSSHEIILGTSPDGKPEGAIDGFGAYKLKKDDKGELILDDNNQKQYDKDSNENLIPEAPKKSEFKLKYGGEGHLLNYGRWQTYITKDYNGTFDDTYDETIKKDVTHNYNAQLISNIGYGVQLDWANEHSGTGNILLKHYGGKQQILFSEKGTQFILSQYNKIEEESDKEIKSYFGITSSSGGLPKLYNVQDSANKEWRQKEKNANGEFVYSKEGENYVSREGDTNIRLYSKNSGNIKILQSKDQERIESQYAADHNIDETCGIILSSLSNDGIGLYAEKPRNYGAEDTNEDIAETKRSYVNFKMQPSSNQPAFYLNAGGSFIESPSSSGTNKAEGYIAHDIKGDPELKRISGIGSYILSEYDTELRNGGVTSKNDTPENQYRLNGVRIGPSLMTHALRIDSVIGLAELKNKPYGSWADEAGLYVVEGIKADGKIWSHDGIYAGQSGPTDKSPAYMTKDGHIVAKEDITVLNEDGINTQTQIGKYSNLTYSDTYIKKIENNEEEDSIILWAGTGKVEASSFKGDGTEVTNTSDGENVASNLTLSLSEDGSISLDGSVPSVSEIDATSETGRAKFSSTSIEESINLNEYIQGLIDTALEGVPTQIGVSVDPNGTNGVKVTVYLYNSNGGLVDSEEGSATLEIEGSTPKEDPNAH